MRRRPNPAAVVLVLIGAILVIVGLFLPAFTCKEIEEDSFEYCEKENGSLFQTDAFEDEPFESESSWGFFVNMAQITIISMAVLALIAVLTRSGLSALCLALLGFLVFEGFLLWDELDQTNDVATSIEISFGWGWIVLGIGMLLLLIGAAVNLASRAQPVPYPPPGYYPQQPPSYSSWS